MATLTGKLSVLLPAYNEETIIYANALEAARQILVKRFAFDIEVLAIINARGYKITSAPIEVVFHRASFGRIGYQDIRNMFVDTLAIFYRLHILHYYDKADTLERS